MPAFIPAHFTLACLFAFFMLDDSTLPTRHDPPSITNDYFIAHDTLLYAPVCAQGQTYLNAEVAQLAGATDTGEGCCSSYGTVAVAEPNRFWISGVELNQMSKQSGPNGYSNHANLIFEVFKNDSNSISLHRKPTGLGLQQWKVWIDFNGDQQFGPEELVVDAAAQDLAVPFFLPEKAELGSLTRMRIFTGQPGASLVGNTLPVGEVEDYTVQVVP